MIVMDIPGQGSLQIDHLVLDVNGTIAVDGCLLEGVQEALAVLSQHVQVHMLTANTHGKQEAIDRELGMRASIIPPGEESEAKAAYVRDLGPEHVVAIGQGANDAGMLAEAAIGICVLSKEGTAIQALQAADVLIPDIRSALNALQNPYRLVATLRA